MGENPLIEHLRDFDNAPLESRDTRLSICIATYKRGAFIAETLDSIIPQMSPGVELVVVDGASPDNTPEVMADYVARYPSIRYFREQENSGIDKDYDKAVGYATGRYCWLMTDDDLLRPGAIGRVLQALDGQVELVVVNTEVRTADLSKVLEPGRLPLREDRTYGPGDGDRVFADLANSLSFIGCAIIRRDLWLARRRDPYYGTLFIHVGVIFQSPPLERVRALAEPEVVIRYGNAMWTPRGFEIWMFKWPGLLWSFEAISAKAKAAVSAQEPWRSLKKLFLYRAIGGYSVVEYRRFLAGKVGALARLPFLLIACIPAPLANLLGSIYCAFLNRRARVGLYDLLRSDNAPTVSRLLTRYVR